jgi:hypothetical protein
MDDHWVLYNRTTQWKLVFSFLPRRCKITKRRMWLEQCYRGFTFIAGPGDPVEEYVYLTTETFIVESLAGRIK